MNRLNDRMKNLEVERILQIALKQVFIFAQSMIRKGIMSGSRRKAGWDW
jgi:hypothetical protein